VILLGVIGNHISAVIPNPFRYFASRLTSTTTSQVWYGAAIRNNLHHTIDVGIWSNSRGIWIVDGLNSDETKWYQDTGPLFMDIQGDMILRQNPEIHLTHTYDGEECYELEMKAFDHAPSGEELKLSPLNRIDEILGGDSPKTISFVDGTKKTFEVFGPTGIKLQTLFPVKYKGETVFPFQVPHSNKNED
jgi:hypothetical protein